MFKQNLDDFFSVYVSLSDFLTTSEFYFSNFSLVKTNFIIILKVCAMTGVFKVTQNSLHIWCFSSVL